MSIRDTKFMKARLLRSVLVTLATACRLPHPLTMDWFSRSTSGKLLLVKLSTLAVLSNGKGSSRAIVAHHALSKPKPPASPEHQNMSSKQWSHRNTIRHKHRRKHMPTH